MRIRAMAAAVVAPSAAVAALAQAPALSPEVRRYVSVDAPVVALTHVRVTPVEAIRVVTMNGARYPWRYGRTGSTAAGNAADLSVGHGNPTATIAEIERVEIVFNDGVGCDPNAFVAAAKGRVGLR